MGQRMVAEMTDRETRHLVALNADVVGFSRLMADDAASTTETMEAYRHLVEAEVEAGSGTLVNFVGDSFMAVFDDAMNAIGVAIAISGEIEGRNAGLLPHRLVRFRMGIDQGEVTRTEGQYFGDALNVAARIQEKARAGGVSISGRVFRALDEPALRFRSLGRLPLRNIPEPVDIFEFSDLPRDGIATPAPGPVRSAREIPTLVLLPIHTETVDDQIRSISEVVRSDLLHRLAELPRLAVIDGRTAAPTSHGPAEYMLETGVHQIGDQIRIYAKVIHVATMNLVTSHRWTATADELFALTDTISDEVSLGVAVEIIIGQPARVYSSTGDAETTRKIYQGWYQLTRDSYEGWREAVEIFEAVARDHPEEVYGHSLTAFATWLGAASGFVDDPEPLLDKAFDQASMVLDMGDPTGLGHMVLGAIHMARGRTDDALEVIERATITRPTCDMTYAVQGSVRRYLGHWEKAVDLMDTAIRLSALPPAWYPSVMACSLFIGGRLDMAGATAEQVVADYPNSLEALLVLTAVQTEMGLERRALATADVVRDRFPGVDIDQWLNRSPFKDHGIIDRWRNDLAQVGLVVSPPA